MKNVLIVLPNDSLGGAEQVLKMVAYQMTEFKVEIIFLRRTGTCHWKDIPDNVKLHYKSSVSKWLGLLFFISQELFKPKRDFEFVFTTHTLVTGTMGIIIWLGIIKKKYFVARESTRIFDRFFGWKRFVYKKIYEFGYLKIDLLICQTDQMKQGMILNLPWIENRMKIVVIPNPIETPRCEGVKGIDLDYPYVIAAGRLIREKGFDLLFEAFRAISKLYPNYHLLVLGEGTERKRLEKQISVLQIKNNVALIGHVADVNPFFKNAELCVVSSRIEGFPNVLLQMMSLNTKIVSTNCAGGIDVIPGVFLAESGNSESLEQAMLLALQTDTGNNKELFSEFLKNNSPKDFLLKMNECLHIGLEKAPTGAKWN